MWCRVDSTYSAREVDGEDKSAVRRWSKVWMRGPSYDDPAYEFEPVNQKVLGVVLADRSEQGQKRMVRGGGYIPLDF